MMFGIFIILYVLQVLVASWYQRHWRYGPMEYLLRMFTYWQLRVGKKNMRDIIPRKSLGQNYVLGYELYIGSS